MMMRPPPLEAPILRRRSLDGFRVVWPAKEECWIAEVAIASSKQEHKQQVLQSCVQKQFTSSSQFSLFRHMKLKIKKKTRDDPFFVMIFKGSVRPSDDLRDRDHHDHPKGASIP
jgi:hypothetical protein